jgi:hypothetical protein
MVVVIHVEEVRHVEQGGNVDDNKDEAAACVRRVEMDGEGTCTARLREVNGALVVPAAGEDMDSHQTVSAGMADEPEDGDHREEGGDAKKLLDCRVR